MGVDVAPVDLRVLVRSAEARRGHGLFVNDSLVVAAAHAVSADGIASADKDFGRVTDLTLFSPTDLG
ncbi:MAG: PIN domain-containing protein [Acidobacteria bacterium]|nr:PIN domain-containing protein [Acidobacteriota bacterium]